MRQRLHRAATIAAVLIVFGSSGAIAGRGGFRGGSMGGFRGGSMGGFRGGSMSEFHGGSMGGFRGGSMSEFHGGSASGFHAGGASSFGTSHSYGGYGGASGAGRSPYGGSSSAGYRGGSFDTARGGTVNYGAAGRTATGPGGATAGRGAYGVSGTTAGGRSYGGVGRVGGAVGPGGNAVGGRSSFGMASGPNGMVAGGSRSGFVAGGSRGYGGGVWHGGGYGNYGGYNSRWMHGNWGGGYGGYGGYGGWGLGGIGLGVGLGLASWGLGSSLYSGGWGYMPYSNPYYVQAAGNFPQAAGYYDYSQPIDTTSADAPAAVAEPAMSAFDQARAAFLAGDYPQALSLVDQAIKGTPNNSAAHEFRGVTLFALGRYDDAAGTLYGVLSVGPGWDWTTLISLYADVENLHGPTAGTRAERPRPAERGVDPLRPGLPLSDRRSERPGDRRAEANRVPPTGGSRVDAASPIADEGPARRHRPRTCPGNRRVRAFGEDRRHLDGEPGSGLDHHPEGRRRRQIHLDGRDQRAAAHARGPVYPRGRRAHAGAG